jgi:hypothetical protein
MKIALTTDSFVEGQGGVSTSIAALDRDLCGYGLVPSLSRSGFPDVPG